MSKILFQNTFLMTAHRLHCSYRMKGMTGLPHQTNETLVFAQMISSTKVSLCHLKARPEVKSRTPPGITFAD